MTFDAALSVANAVFYEGYLLYPYRASALKNRMRWQFGVVAPRPYSEATGLDPWQMQTEWLMEPLADPRLAVRLRFMHLEARSVHRLEPDGSFSPVDALEVDGERFLPWDEGIERAIEARLSGPELLAGRTIEIAVPGSEEFEEVRDATGRLRGRILRRALPLLGMLVLRAQPQEAPSPLWKLTLRIENGAAWGGAASRRDEALPCCFLSAHALIAVEGGMFLSMTEPPEWARLLARACVNLHSWPVLAGEPGRGVMLLASPIILEDYPRIAPESPGDLFDATEIDELLTLRTSTLTESEKTEARATDHRASAIIDRSDLLPPEVLEHLHGAIRELHHARVDEKDWPPRQQTEAKNDAQEKVIVDSRRLARGSRVRVRLGARRTDAQDMFLDGKTAVVEAVLRDVEDRAYLAVSMEDAPGGELHHVYGRYLYFYPDEVEPLEDAPR